MRGTHSSIRHDRGVELEGIADSAVFIGVFANGAEIQLVWVGYIVIPLIAVILPRDIPLDHYVANAGYRGRRNGEDGVVLVFVGEGIVAIAEVARVVVVQQIVVSGLAAQRNLRFQRLQILRNRRHARLSHVRTRGVGTAAKGRRPERTPAVAIFRVPVVGFGRRIWIFDFVHNSCIRGACRNQHLMRRNCRVALAVAEPDHVAVAEHDVVGAGATVDGLVEVVAHRIVISELLEVRHVAVLDVIKAHCRGTFAGGHSTFGKVRAEVSRLRLAILS